ncbi:geranylgeranylglycerol-phosphate geranylgeranyltransferase [candidate division KSB1 bacterium]|nr:geranylgeranylglycerol-phosphate geranylgeranyltransferase [candidate division KSB1 bacterium]
MEKLKHYFILSRPLNVFIAMLSIFIGAFITGTISPLLKVIFACISGGLIAGGANVINDYFDVEIDKINKPHRPIAAGAISLKQAFAYSVFLYFIGIVFGWLVNWQAFVISVFSSILLFLYSAKLKRTVLWGNLSVSLLTALAFIYGGIAVNRLSYAIIPAVFSFVYHLGREIIKDVEDIEGDRADKITTFPIVYGAIPALKLATVVYLILILFTIIPFVLKIFGLYYLIVVIGIVDVVVIYVLISMWKNYQSDHLSRLSIILKLNMFAGLVAIYCGKF